MIFCLTLLYNLDSETREAGIEVDYPASFTHLHPSSHYPINPSALILGDTSVMSVAGTDLDEQVGTGVLLRLGLLDAVLVHYRMGKGEPNTMAEEEGNDTDIWRAVSSIRLRARIRRGECRSVDVRTDSKEGHRCCIVSYPSLLLLRLKTYSKLYSYWCCASCTGSTHPWR